MPRPFGDEGKLAEYLIKGNFNKLRVRLETNLKALRALYEYGRLHGEIRLCWRGHDEWLPAPWVHHDEPGLYEMKQVAIAMRTGIEVVLGKAPPLEDPWSRSTIIRVGRDFRGNLWLVDADREPIDDVYVQRARLAAPRG